MLSAYYLILMSPLGILNANVFGRHFHLSWVKIRIVWFRDSVQRIPATLFYGIIVLFLKSVVQALLGEGARHIAPSTVVFIQMSAQ